MDLSGIIAFEVKHAARPTRADAQQLAWLRDQAQNRFLAGYVAHTGGDVFPLGERVWAVPMALVAGA